MEARFDHPLSRPLARAIDPESLQHALSEVRALFYQYAPPVADDPWSSARIEAHRQDEIRAKILQCSGKRPGHTWQTLARQRSWFEQRILIG